MKKLQYILLILIFSSCQDTPSACFSIDSESIENDGYPKTGEKVKFKNCSENSDSYYWDFGDGETSSKQNPTHQYNEADFYTITCQATTNKKTSTSTSYLNIISLDGEWIGYITVNNTPLPVSIELEQNDDEIEGEFSFSDDSGKTDISDGEIDENNIEFEITISYSEGDDIKIEFEGEVNSTYSNMSGDIEINNGTATGIWNIYREASKSAILPLDITLSDSLKNILSN